MTDAVFEGRHHPRVLVPHRPRQHIVAARAPGGITAAVGRATHHHDAFPLPERAGHAFRLHPETAIVEARAPTGRDARILAIVRGTGGADPTLLTLDLAAGAFQRLYSPGLPGTVDVVGVPTQTNFRAFARHDGLLVAACHDTGRFYTINWPGGDTVPLGAIQAGIDAMASFTDADGGAHLWGADGGTGYIYEIDLPARASRRAPVAAHLYADPIRSMLTYRPGAPAAGGFVVATLTSAGDGTVLHRDAGAWRRRQMTKPEAPDRAFLTTHNQRLLCLRQAANGLATVDDAQLEEGRFGIYSAVTTSPPDQPTYDLGAAGIWHRDLSQPAAEAELGAWQPAANLPPTQAP